MSPQHDAEPSLSEAHVQLVPSAICATPTGPDTALGTARNDSVPPPSCPRSFLPLEHATVPSPTRAHVWEPPALICVTSRAATGAPGATRTPGSPSPRRPRALEPQQSTASRPPKDREAFHFVLVGDGYLKAELESKSVGLTNITFIPKIRKNQVQAMLKHFDVCFVGRNDSPLFQHGVSANKYFDYMLAGKPVLDANNYIKDPVELSGCGIIVRPESAEAIVQGVLQLYNMPADERERMGRLGYEYVTKHHSIRYLAEVYLGVIEEGSGRAT